MTFLVNCLIALDFVTPFQMLELRNKIQAVQAQNSTWNDICYR